jgi:protein-arginine deiminase
MALVACSGGGKEGDGLTGDDDDDTTLGDDDDDVPGDDDDDVVPTGTDTAAPTTDTATTDTGGTTGPVGLSAPETVYGVRNIDNDNDWREADATDDDLFPLLIEPSAGPADELVLTVGGTGNVRIYHDGALLIDDTDGASAAIPWQPDPVEVLVEFGEFNVDGTLVIEEVAGGSIVDSAETRLRSAPLILNHHLQPAETVVSVAVSFYGDDNDAFIAGYEDVLGKNFESINGWPYFMDPWVQDEIEFATSYTPDSIVMDTVIDSIRDRGLDDYPEDRWQGEDFGVIRFSPFAYANSLDSFGNLEVSPPVDGYPFGRIYYGATPGYKPADENLFEYLDDMTVQEPFTLDTSWLCVGHVDEYLAFIPDPDAPRGFRLLYTDTNAAWDILESMDPTTQLPRYSGRANHDIDTVGELLADQGLRDLNDDLQSDFLDGELDKLITELGLLPEEIIAFPGIFEEAPFCGPYVASLIPGMVNLVVTDFDNGTQIFMADPFLREDLADQSSDAMIQAVTDLLPKSVTPVFLDDWDIYHLGLGEVHCGSNVVRTPSFEDWWTNDLGGTK